MASRTITIRLMGSAEDKGEIRLSAFIEQLDAFLKALKETEKAISGQDQQFLDYRVVDLSHGSPYTVVIKCIAPKEAPVKPASVVTNFVSGIRNVSEKRPPRSATLSALEAYRELRVPKRRIETLEVVEAKNKVVPIDSRFSENVEKVIGPDTVAFGTIAGRLEAVNLHGKVKRFDIFPTVGPRKVGCIFKKDLLPKVKQALDNYVTVSGKLRYKMWNKYPYMIDAIDIPEIHEPNETLSSLRDLRGIAPDATGDLSAEDFVRSIRKVFSN